MLPLGAVQPKWISSIDGDGKGLVSFAGGDGHEIAPYPCVKGYAWLVEGALGNRVVLGVKVKFELL